MPLKQATLKLARKVGCLGSLEREQEHALTETRPGVAPDEAEVTESGRPHRDLVENEAREFWQEITNPGSLIKPTAPNIARVSYGPGGAVQAEKSLAVDVGPCIGPVLVGGFRHAPDDLVIAQLAAAPERPVEFAVWSRLRHFNR